MPCNTCSFYSFPKSECRINPPAPVGGFAKVDGLDWCAKHRPDQDLLSATGCLNTRNHPGKTSYDGPYPVTLPGEPLTEEELAENKMRGEGILAKRKSW